MPATPQEYLRLINRQNAVMNALHNAASRRQAAIYSSTVANPLRAQVDVLLTAVEAQKAKLGVDFLSQSAVRGMSQYKRLVSEAERLLEDYAEDFGQTALPRTSSGAASLGVSDFGVSINTIVGRRVPIEVLTEDEIVKLLNYLDPDGPLAARLEQLAPVTTEKISARVLAEVARGAGPKTIARALNQTMGAGLTDAIRMQRTLQNWTYRETRRAQRMANADILEGWYWWATLGDGRACLSCIANHGQLFPNEAQLNDHHSGRCAPVPAVIGGPQLVTETGEEWFNKQSKSKQRGIMGETMHDAFDAGKFEFNKLSVPYQNDVYGEMRRQATLGDVLGDE